MPVPAVRVEVAFASQPDAATQAWTDVTAYTDLAAGISITRGRSDEFSQVQPGQLTLTLDNSDGRFTAFRSSSPYYPNVKIGRAIRVYAGSRAGNLLSAEDASFEGGTVGGWVTGGTAGVVRSNSTTQAQNGTRSLQVVWNNSLQSVELPVSGLTIGTTYTVSAYVYVGGVTGGSVGIGVVGISISPTRSSWNNTWGRLSYTFTATANSHTMQVNVIGSTSRTDYVDAVMLEEGTSASTFTTTAPAGPRFTGYVDEWPVEWAPGAFYARAQVTASDRLKRLGQIGEFLNVMSEEIRYDGPAFYYTLGEDSDSTTAGDFSASSQGVLSTQQVNSGGTLAFGGGTGPGKDGLSAPLFTPVSVGQGKYLQGSLYSSVGYPNNAVTLRASVRTNATALQTAARILDGYGSFLTLDTSAAGKLVVQVASAFSGVLATVTSATSVNDNATHSLAATITISGGTATLEAFIDGVSAGTATYSASNLPTFVWTQVGGTSAGQLFNGTISHVAGFNSALTAARLLAQHQAGATGFAGESSNARLARYARWAGITDTAFETGGSTTIAHIDTTGQAPLAAMQTVVDTEDGVLFVNGSGVLVFHARAHRYSATVAASLTSNDIGTDTTFKSNDALLANDITASRSGGAMVRVTDASSIADYGSYRKQIELVTTSDLEVVDAANWFARRQSQPYPRAASLPVDLLTNTSIQTAVQALEIGSRISVSSMPSQAPSTTADLFVEGWTETVSTQEWSQTFNTSPSAQSSVLVLDDAEFGALDAYPLAY